MRRLIDIGFAIVALLVLSPLFLLIGIVIVLEDQGGPFYGGWRVGEGGRRFRIWKFRTMVANADRLGGAITTAGDSRVTRVGSFLRKTKLDELPQFFNLLIGNLTLVGPRPEDPGIADHYTAEQRQIFKVKPGITGPTQLLYTVIESAEIPDGEQAQPYYLNHILGPKLRLDLEYAGTRTFFSDLSVVTQTLLLMARSLTQSRS